LSPAVGFLTQSLSVSQFLQILGLRCSVRSINAIVA